MDKAEVVRRLIAQVESDLDAVAESQRSTQEGAVHEENRAEDDKDTRAIESQYLARGLAVRVEELRETLAVLTSMALRTFGADDKISISALVIVEDEEGVTSTYLVAPVGGGRRVDDVVVVTPPSPLGRALIGKQTGDEVTIRTPKAVRVSEVIRVS